MRGPLTCIVSIGLLLFSCRSADIYFSHPYTKIETLPGPEDMVLDTINTDAQIIIGCAARRKTEGFVSGIQYYTLSTGEVQTYTIKNFPDSLVFNPHGIDLGVYRGEKILWVINHEDEKKRQSVIRFRIKKEELEFDTLFIDQLIVSPNDICDGGNGTFYFTNDASSRNAGLELVLKIKGGSIVYYDGKDFTPFNRKFSYPNGIIKFRDELFFSTSRQNKIFRIKLANDGSMIKDSVNFVVKGKGWDNFSIQGDHLLCTSHTKPLKFLKHRKHETHESPFRVYSINPVTKTKGIVYHTDGESMSAGSTAIYYKGDLFICQVFDPYILKVQLHTY